MRMFPLTKDDDAYANRFVLAGIFSFIAACGLVVCTFSSFGWPVVFSFLPHTLRPVMNAQPGETLMLIATFDGSEGSRLADTLDTELANRITSTYLYNARSGRVADIPKSDEEAIALAERYGAQLVVWGERSGESLSIRFTILTALHPAEPRSFSMAAGVNDSYRLGNIAMFCLALMQGHSADMYNGDNSLFAMDGTLADESDIALVAGYHVFFELANGSPSQALSTVQTTARNYPNNASLQAMLALAYAGNGQYPAALTAADDAVNLDPTLAQAYIVRAQIHADSGDPEKAIVDLKAAASLDPDNIEILVRIAETHAANGDLKKAIDDYTALIAARPDNATYYQLRGTLYATDGQRDNAFADFDTAYDKAGEGLLLYGDARLFVIQARAEAHSLFQEYDEAIADYDLIIGVDSANSQALMMRGIARWEKGDEDGARADWALYNTAIGYTMQDASGLNNLAWALSQEGLHDAALPYIEESIQLDPKSPEATHTLGYVYLGLERFEEAAKAFENAIVMGVQYDPIYRDLGDAYFGMGKYTEAITNYNAYLTKDPNAIDREIVEQRIEEAIEKQ